MTPSWRGHPAYATCDMSQLRARATPKPAKQATRGYFNIHEFHMMKRRVPTTQSSGRYLPFLTTNSRYTHTFLATHCELCSSLSFYAQTVRRDFTSVTLTEFAYKHLVPCYQNMAPCFPHLFSWDCNGDSASRRRLSLLFHNIQPSWSRSPEATISCLWGLLLGKIRAYYSFNTIFSFCCSSVGLFAVLLVC